MRFPRPSMSIDKRMARRHLDPTTGQLDPIFLRNVMMSCPVFEMVEIFLFPDELLKKQQIKPLFLSGRYPEIPLIAREMLSKKEAIQGEIQRTTIPTLEETNLAPTITLRDVFKTIRKESYPFLWNVVVKMLSFMPTSASCEQSLAA